METGKRVLRAPKGPQLVRGSDPTNSAVKLFIFGPWGSGKSFSIKGLLEHNFKVLVATTDAGGSGLNSVKLALQREGKAALLDNLYEIILEDDEQVQVFLSDPATYIPDIYDIDPDWLVWDGFGSWQQVYLSEKIGKMPVPRTGNKELPEAVEEGLQFEVAQWGMLRNGTYRAVHKFCALNNVKTKKVWNKIVTSQEAYKSKEQEGLIETGKPLLQGAGGILMGGAFDLIIRTKEVSGIGEGGKRASKFMYQFQAGNMIPKNRGFDLPPQIEADMFKLWDILNQQLKGNKSETTN